MTLSLFENPEPDPFTQWWAMYPRKVAKKAAQKAFQKAAREAHPQALLSALTVQLPYLTQQMQRGFCPHPTTWLNQGRWEDTPAHVAPVQQGNNGFLTIAQQAWGNSRAVGQ